MSSVSQKAIITLEIAGAQSTGTIELDMQRNVAELTAEQTFLVSEAIRTALIHEKGMLHDMVKQLVEETRK